MSLLDEVQQASNKMADHTDTSGGGGDFDNSPPDAGPATFRFIGYVEMGDRPEEYQGKPKTPTREVRLMFQVMSKRHIKTYEKDGVTHEFRPIITVKHRVKTGEKAAFGKMFRKMRRERSEITNMAQMLGEAFYGKIVHGKSADGSKTYANLRDADGNWQLEEPRLYDPVAETWQNIDVAAATEPVKLLLWDYPSKAQWDSIYIEGEREVTEKLADGTEVKKTVSKNWMQEDIVKNALDFEGSPLEAIVAGLGNLKIEKAESKPAAAEKPTAGVEVAKSEPAPAETTAADPAPAQEPQKANQSAADMLAGMGL